jgi:hypothetical protein
MITNMQNADTTQTSKIRLLINMMLSPGTALKNATSGMPVYFSFIVSGLAFGLFFLQTGLDLYRTGQQQLIFAIVTAIIGTTFGITVIPALGVLSWGISKPFGGTKTLKWTVSAFCMSYSGALIYCLLGIAMSISLGWRTSVAFGVTGVLWAIGPMISTIREMVNGKIYLCVILASIIGALVLFCWSFIGRY